MNKPMKKHQLTISSPEPLNIQQIGYGFTVTYGNTPPEQISISMQSEGGEEPKPSFKKWRAKSKGTYHYVNDLGQINISREENRYDDNYRYLTSNYFQTREEAKAYKARQEAIGRVTHAIIEANDGWVPDWINDFSAYNIIVEHGVVMNVTHCTLQSPTLFPYCKTKEIARSIIASHKEDLDLFFNVKK